MSEATAKFDSASEKKRILIVDDHPVLRRGLAVLIEADPGLRVCAEADSYGTGLAALKENRPDLVIVDIEIGGRDGLSLIRDMKIHHPNIPALVLSMHDEAIYGERALKAGALGYITKKQLDETILVAIHRLLNGDAYISNAVGARLAAKFASGGAPGKGSLVESLSDRELQVFRLVGGGRTTRQIAKKLALSIKTIETHLEHIKRKLVLGSAAELAQRASRWVKSSETD